ncbi:hypothetical protein EXIGLDRAFT_419918 [Exidia glandulosa HHB12029]|uniref:Uncharacterized protein n=1 Tax=Exidia glandulosa HHB12029 TaxID=1314781 RepID=A0A166BNJ7_EXIGL|nr:hypothetical protein EXIGLDRAFT_419918 [Exidia glandulosa HHB12029]
MSHRKCLELSATFLTLAFIRDPLSYSLCCAFHQPSQLATGSPVVLRWAQLPLHWRSSHTGSSLTLCAPATDRPRTDVEEFWISRIDGTPVSTLFAPCLPSSPVHKKLKVFSHIQVLAWEIPIWTEPRQWSAESHVALSFLHIHTRFWCSKDSGDSGKRVHVPMYKRVGFAVSMQVLLPRRLWL